MAVCSTENNAPSAVSGPLVRAPQIGDSKGALVEDSTTCLCSSLGLSVLCSSKARERERRTFWNESPGQSSAVKTIESVAFAAVSLVIDFQ